MREQDLQSWQEFEKVLHDLRRQRRERETSATWLVSPFLFRGQRNYAWNLSTTLERERKLKDSFREYYRFIVTVLPQIEVFTGRHWQLPEIADYEKDLCEGDLVGGKIPACNYKAYLRQHGFPSPLLDWTLSPYVAAYFAFADAAEQHEKVSIYVYMEFDGTAKQYSKGKPFIATLPPYLRTHKRHFLQQCQYTICFTYEEEWRYASHEDVFSEGSDRQDVLWKFNIPISQKLEMLTRLDEQNINAYGLFSSEDSLMETIALRELHLRAAGL